MQSEHNAFNINHEDTINYAIIFFPCVYNGKHNVPKSFCFIFYFHHLIMVEFKRLIPNVTNHRQNPSIQVCMEEDISTLQMETYVMLIKTGYNTVTSLSILPINKQAACDKPYDNCNANCSIQHILPDYGSLNVQLSSLATGYSCTLHKRP